MAGPAGERPGVPVGDPAHVPLPVDVARYSVRDAAGVARVAAVRWRHAVEGLDELPHGVVVALGALGDALRAAGCTGDDLAALAAGLEVALDERGRGRPSAPLVDVVGVDDPLTFAVAALEGLLSAAARLVAVDVVPRSTGRLASVQVSDGGVPKTPVPAAEVGFGGVEGDAQAVRKHHGRPSQAVSLWSAEVIADLAADGHPVGPGAAGENLTVAGLDWAALRPGARLAFGGAGAGAEGGGPVVELTGWAEPCRTIAGCFSDGGFRRIDHERHPGTSRAYAAVVRPGRLAAGDEVRVLP